jgi:hypothetical protein
MTPPITTQVDSGWPGPVFEPGPTSPPDRSPAVRLPNEPGREPRTGEVCLATDFVDAGLPTEANTSHTDASHDSGGSHPLSLDPASPGGEGDRTDSGLGVDEARLSEEPPLESDDPPAPSSGRLESLSDVALAPHADATDVRPAGSERPRRARPGRRAGGTKGDSARSRARGQSQAIEPGGRDPATPPGRAEWPSVQDILATHRAIPKPQTPAVPKPASRLQVAPTLARLPEQWNPPAWLAGPPAVIFVCAVGLIASVLSWRWAADSYSASIMTDRLMSAGQSSQRRPLPDSIGPPAGSWMQSTAQHLAHWAIFLNRNGTSDELVHGEIKRLLERALEASPVNATARLAVAQLEPSPARSAVPIRALGLSRDAVSLSHSAGRLLAAGHRDAALHLYSQALLIGSSAEPARGTVPGFNKDPAVARYLLPGEERVRDIARSLVSATDWKFADWSRALPTDPTTLLAVARLLREVDRSEAEDLLKEIINEPPLSVDRQGPSGRALAARAEAFALLSRWKQAAEQYHQAIELAGDDTIRRSWWFNLAEIAQRLDDQRERDTALRAALVSGPSDEISRRAANLQRTTAAPLTPIVRSTNPKAN